MSTDKKKVTEPKAKKPLVPKGWPSKDVKKGAGRRQAHLHAEQVKRARAGALIAAKKQQKGQVLKRRNWRTSVHFNRPVTFAPRSNPKYVRRAVAHVNKMDPYRIIKHPLTSETAMKKIDENNTLVFIVDLRANKYQIKSAVRKLYDIKPVKVNTLIRPDGQKKAFIRLGKDVEALDIANKIGIL